MYTLFERKSVGKFSICENICHTWNEKRNKENYLSIYLFIICLFIFGTCKPNVIWLYVSQMLTSLR